MVDRHMRLIKRTHWVLCNFSNKSINAGGVIVLVSKKSVPLEGCITQSVIIPGRVSRVLIQGVGCKQIVFNIHNIDLDMPVVCAAIKADLLNCSMDTIRGDFDAHGTNPHRKL